MSAEATYRGTASVPESTFKQLAEAHGIRVTGTVHRSFSPWGGITEVRFTARHDDPEVLADFVHEIGAARV